MAAAEPQDTSSASSLAAARIRVLLSRRGSDGVSPLRALREAAALLDLETVPEAAVEAGVSRLSASTKRPPPPGPPGM